MTIMNFRKLFVKLNFYNKYYFDNKKKMNSTEIKLLVME